MSKSKKRMVIAQVADLGHEMTAYELSDESSWEEIRDCIAHCVHVLKDIYPPAHLADEENQLIRNTDFLESS